MSNVFSEVKIHPVTPGKSSTKAFVSCKVNTSAGSVKLNSIALKEGINGLIIDYPKRSQNKGGRSVDIQGFDDYFYLEHDLKEELEALATAEYYKLPETQRPIQVVEVKKAEFPQLIHYKDRDEYVVVDSWAEVDRNRPFELA